MEELYIARNLRLLRQRSEKTLEEIAEVTGVTRQAVSKWETGESVPDMINAVKLASIFQVTLDAFVLEDLSLRSAATGSDKVIGTVKVGENGTFQIPDEVLKMFGIEPGENVLLLADRAQGIAIMKCRSF